MKCDKCNNEATVLFEQNINGKVTKQCLCEKCAQELNIDTSMKKFNEEFTDILDNMFNFNFGDYLTIDEPKKVKCSVCGNSYDDFIHKTKLSCANCYNTFKTDLDNVIKRLQASNRHIGKKYLSLNDNINKKVENKQNLNVENRQDTIEQLKEKLNKAIEEERYEDAAIIRDEIKKRSN